MPVFEYSALNRKGRKVSGIIAADGPAAARLRLSQDMIFPVEVREVKEKAKRFSAETFLSSFSVFKRINPVEVTIALRQLATLVSSALPLVECLNGLIEQTEHAQLKKIFIQIREKVVEGSSLSQAMAEHPAVFSPIYFNMVMASETGGALDIILKRLADFSEGRMKLKKKVEAALVYPIVLIMISGIILLFLMSFVMPKVIGVFQGMELALPLSTRVLILITHFLKQFWWLVCLGIVVLGLIISTWIKSDKGRRIWDKIRLRIPFLGRLHHKVVIARFTRTLSLLLRSGLVLVDSLETARLSMGNRIMEDAVKETIKFVGEGEDLATPLKRTGRFPPLVIQLIQAGEKSGNLEEMLAKAAEVYEDDVDSAISSLTSIIEPAVILVMGGIVGFIVMAILLPIFDMTGGMK